VEAEFARVRSRRDEVRSTECAEEVVERVLVGQMDDREADAPLVLADAEVDIPAYSQVERPIASRDCVLDIKTHFLDVGAALEPKEGAATSQVKWK